MTMASEGTPDPLVPVPQLLTVREVAQLLKMSERSVWRLIRDKQIQVIRIRGAVRFSPKQVDDWIAACLFLPAVLLQCLLF